MPVAVRITQAEATALNDAQVAGVEGLVLTYRLEDGPAILGKVSLTSPVWHRLADRLTGVARQLGATTTFFKEPEEAEETPAHAPAVAPVEPAHAAEPAAPLAPAVPPAV